MDFSTPAPPRRFQLCTIEPTTELVNGSMGVTGTLVLSRVEENYQLHWTPDEGTLTHHITAVVNSPSKIPDSKWKANKKFKVDCQRISTIQLRQSPLSLTISRSDHSIVRTFAFGPSEFISMTELVEQLIINGIAVPAPPEQKEDKYLLYFYRECHRNIYSYTPPHFQLSVVGDNDLDVFWDSLHDFFTKLVIHLDQCNSLPKDQCYPLNVAAEASHQRVLDEIKNSKNELTFNSFDHENGNKSIINNGNDDFWTVYHDMFNEEGQIKDFALFKKRVYLTETNISHVKDIIPFIFGVFSSDSTFSEREKKKMELEKEFKQLYFQCSSLKTEQISNNHLIESAFRVIRNDVLRTDRFLNAFQKPDSIGLEILTRLLKTYCIFNPPIGYLQGMNDLFVPIILAYIPNWTEDGVPIFDDDDENEKNDDISELDENIEKSDFEKLSPIIKDDAKKNKKLEKILSLIFWCFDAMLRNTDHLKLLSDVTGQCKLIAKEVNNIFSQVSPIAAIWMQRNAINEFLWLYSDFVLLFKRSFQNPQQNQYLNQKELWRVWLQLNCLPTPEKSLTYFVTSIIMHCFRQLTTLPTVEITTMMDAFPKILQTVDMESIATTILWLIKKVPPQKSKNQTIFVLDNKNNSLKVKGFKFFETAWTGPAGQMQSIYK